MTPKRLTAALLALLLCACPAWAQLTIKGPASVPRDRLAELSADGAASGAALVWDISPEEKADTRELGGRLYFVAPPGVYRVKCRAVSVDKSGAVKIETARHTVTVGEVPPDPGPGPGPNPPVPPVPPGPALPGKGLRVYVIYETAELSKLPQAQVNVLTSQDVRAYLNAKCGFEEGVGRTWDFLDKDAPVLVSKVAQAALAVPRQSLPWLVVATDAKGGYSGPLPATIDETLALLRKYGD